MGSSEVADSRPETEEQRNDRNLGELVQELRVAGLGVQVLFGFLLSLPFSNRFGQLTGAQRDLYLTCVVLSAVLLVSWYVAGVVAGAVITAILGALAIGLWFAFPLATRSEVR